VRSQGSDTENHEELDCSLKRSSAVEERAEAPGLLPDLNLSADQRGGTG
jgi:hypothetical protein